MTVTVKVGQSYHTPVPAGRMSVVVIGGFRESNIVYLQSNDDILVGNIMQSLKFFSWFSFFFLCFTEEAPLLLVQASTKNNILLVTIGAALTQND